MENIAYHFTSSTLRDGSPIHPIGKTLVFPGTIKICERGYHWSRKPHQALQYAPGSLLHKVQYGGTTQTQEDKGCSSERTIIATIDATHLLRRFAADQALSVSHLWDMPNITKQYLQTLNERIRGAARSAAWDAARSAAWDAARSAAWGAAWDATSSSVLGTAWDEFDHRVYNAFEQTEKHYKPNGGLKG